jgi:NADPH:quinone reductase-like Zn-dependent oxidoreductase
MKAVVFAEYGGPEVLHVADVPEPEPGPGQVRIAVRAAGVNPIDWKIRSGAMSSFMPAEFPVIDAREAAGVVDAVGEGADAQPGAEVFGFTDAGAAAEFAVMTDFAAKPAKLSFEEAAGLPVAAETSVRAFTLLGGLRAGQTIVISGASGGVGAIAVQIAKAHEARVIATASERNHAFLRELGAEPTTYGDGLVERVRALAPEGVDLALDVAGQGAAPALVELTGDPQKVVTIADFAAAALGVKVTSGGEVPRRPALEEAANLIEAGRLRPPVVQTFPFAQAAEAHRLSQEGHVRGKLVLVPGG